MKLSVAILTLCLVGIAFATTAEETEVYTTLQKIEQTKFGKTLIDTIALQMAAGDQVDNLLHLLQGMEDQLEQEQTKADAAIEKYQAECDVELQRLANEIAEAKAEIKRQTAILKEKTAARDKAQIELNDLIAFRDLIQAKLDQIEARYARKKEEWVKEQEEHNYITGVVQQARSIIQANLQQKTGFLQEKQTIPQSAFVQVSNHLLSSIKKANNPKRGILGLLKVLAQIMQSAPVQSDQSGVGRILKLIDQILNSIAQSYEKERNDFQNFEDEYRQIKIALTNRLNDVKQKIADLEALIIILNRAIRSCQDAIAEQTEKFNTKTSIRNQLLAECDQAGIVYGEERAARDQQRTVLSQTLQLFQSKLRLFKKYVNEKLSKLQKTKI